MAEPSAIWSTKLIVFDKSPGIAQNVIMSHGRVALQGLIARIDQLYQLVRDGPPIENVHVHQDIPVTLSDLCFQQGIASTVLFNSGPRSTRENKAAYKLRLDRVEYVRKACTGVPTDILSNRDIRNRLTHIDEFLGLTAPDTGWFIDSAMRRRDEFSPPPGIKVAFCRTYISSEDVLQHLDKEMSISALRNEAAGVLNAIWPQ